ncbi:hypothetical protein AAU61_05405 [Desulfocarbo indianensis]|nr:hypothetical protein AAU61_05405 [Desulfocarbo indianensis]
MSLLNELDRLQHLHGELLGQAQVLLGLLEKGDQEEAFEDAWARRQKTFKELNAMHQRLAPTFAAWEPQGGGLSPGEQSRAQEVFEHIRRLGRQVLDVDRRVAQLLEERRTALMKDLGHIKEVQRVRHAYAGGDRRWWGPDRVSRTG